MSFVPSSLFIRSCLFYDFHCGITAAVFVLLLANQQHLQQQPKIAIEDLKAEISTHLINHALVVGINIPKLGPYVPYELTENRSSF